MSIRWAWSINAIDTPIKWRLKCHLKCCVLLRLGRTHSRVLFEAIIIIMFKSIWSLSVYLVVKQEKSNRHDHFAVAVIWWQSQPAVATIVSHIPREISPSLLHLLWDTLWILNEFASCAQCLLMLINNYCTWNSIQIIEDSDNRSPDNRGSIVYKIHVHVNAGSLINTWDMAQYSRGNNYTCYSDKEKTVQCMEVAKKTIIEAAARQFNGDLWRIHKWCVKIYLKKLVGFEIVNMTLKNAKLWQG